MEIICIYIQRDFPTFVAYLDVHINCLFEKSDFSDSLMQANAILLHKGG